MTTFYPPLRGLRVWLAGLWRRYQCGRRSGHFPVPDWLGNNVCGRCQKPMM